MCLMCTIIPKFTAREAVLFDPRIGTGSIAKAWLLESNHNTFIGCEADSHCVVVVIPSALYVSAEQLLCRNADRQEGADFGAAAKSYISEAQRPEARKRKTCGRYKAACTLYKCFLSIFCTAFHSSSSMEFWWNWILISLAHNGRKKDTED